MAKSNTDAFKIRRIADAMYLGPVIRSEVENRVDSILIVAQCGAYRVPRWVFDPFIAAKRWMAQEEIARWEAEVEKQQKLLDEARAELNLAFTRYSRI